MRFITRAILSFSCVALAVLATSCSRHDSGRLPLQEGDRVVFLGDALIEREQHHAWLEVMLTSRFPKQNVTFRNLGWNADTPAGDSRFGLSLLQAGHEPADEGWKQLVRQLQDAQPTVVFIGYGMASSFAGESGLPAFTAGYARLLDKINEISPNARLVLLGPIQHETLGAPWPDAGKHNAQLAQYAEAIRQLATERKALFVSLNSLSAKTDKSAEKLTDNGIHLNARGYRLLAETIEQQLYDDAGAWRTSAQAEPLREAILRKNEWVFHRTRPANMAYIFGFRKKEQGRNAAEVAQFDDYIVTAEKRIAALRGLKRVDTPEQPLRTGNLVSKFTPQPHPTFEVAEGFEVTLWAENPLLDKPIQMNFDPKGRLWVATSAVYPQIEPGQAASDRVIILEDTTGAGRADKATVFADGLLIPTGLEPGDGGVYVAQSTELLHFADTDGDGKADVRRVVLSGFGTEDSHHNLHTLRWGPDERLYMNQAVYTRTDTETPHGVVRLKAGGIFRFDPRDQKMDILFRGWVNPWGHQFDAFGQSFVTDGAGSYGINWAVPGATYQTLAPFRRVLQSVSPGSYPKFCGIEIIHSAHFPADWQGDVITGDFRANRVVRFKISDHGAGYVTKEMPDLLRSTADSFRPIDVKLGPDGALYVADWSNPIIQHGEVDFRDTRRDKVHGRIWRISAKQRAPLPVVDFTSLTNPQLLAALNSPNTYDQERARRVLVERGSDQVLADLRGWMGAQTGDAAQLQALWMLQAFNQPLSPVLPRLLASSDARIRAAAVRALTYDTSDNLTTLARLVADENPRVRLEAVRVLGHHASAQAADLALSVLDRPMDAFLDYALWLTINELAQPWIQAVKAGEWKIAGNEARLDFALKSIQPALASEVLGQLIADFKLPRDGSGPWIELIGTAGTPKELNRLFVQLTSNGFEQKAALHALSALSNAARLRQVRPDGDLVAINTLFTSPVAEVRLGSIALAGTWQLGQLAPELIKIAGENSSSAQDRLAAFAALRDIGGADVIAALRKLAQENTTTAVRREAVLTLAGLDLKATLPDVIALLKETHNRAEAQALWRSILGIKGAGQQLAAALPSASLPVEVAEAGLRPAREGNQQQALTQVLMQIAGLTTTNASLTSAELQQLAQQAQLQGDAIRGEHLYRRAELACIACHAIGGAGSKVGPDLTSIGASAPPDYLVESLLYPNAKIKEGYHAVSLTTRDRQIVSGIIVGENANEIRVRNAANQEISIATANVSERENVGSLMPGGLMDTLLPEERLDLIKFLSQLGKPGDYDASRGGVARVWRLYLASSFNTHLGVERVIRGDFTLPGWEKGYSLVNGMLPREILDATFAHRPNTRGLYLATQFQSAGGALSLALEGTADHAWINGQPVKPAAQFTVETKPGVNTLVLRVDDTTFTGGLRLSGSGVNFLTE